MEHERLINEFNGLPPLAQRQVFDFISFLRNRYRQYNKNCHAEKPPLSKEPFIGMWKNREDMTDSSSWVRDIRRNIGDDSRINA